MNIVFGNKNVEGISAHIVLPLDTFVLNEAGDTDTAYCIVENTPIDELSQAEHNKKLHNDLMNFYAEKRWEECITLIDHLYGRWGGDVDSFYIILKEKVVDYQENNPPEDWSPFLPLPKHFLVS